MCFGTIIVIAEPLQWRHNVRDSVSNHQPHDCLLKTSKLRVTGLCAGNSPGAGEFPAQMASNVENASIWWRHHGKMHFHSGASLTHGGLATHYMRQSKSLNVFWHHYCNCGTLRTCDKFPRLSKYAFSGSKFSICACGNEISSQYLEATWSFNHIEAKTRWWPFCCRRHFEMHFLDRKVLHFD